MTGASLAFFVGRRLAVLVLLLLVVSFLVFALLFLAPGSPEQVLLGTNPSSPAVIKALRARYHLDESFLGQYWLWLRGALHLEFGDSIRTGRPVLSSIGARMGVTLFLGVYAFVLSVIGGVALGVLAAIRKRGRATARSSGSACSVRAPRRSSRGSSCSTCSRSPSAGSRATATAAGSSIDCGI